MDYKSLQIIQYFRLDYWLTALTATVRPAVNFGIMEGLTINWGCLHGSAVILL